MGAAQSASSLPETDENEIFVDAAAELTTGTRLFAFFEKKHWLVDKNARWKFVNFDPEGNLESDEEEEEDEVETFNWHLKVSRGVNGERIVCTRIDQDLAIQFNDDEMRLEFVQRADLKEHVVDVWSMKFPDMLAYNKFSRQFKSSLFENQFQMEATDENKKKAVGQDFVGWLSGEDADEEMWDAEEDNISVPEELKETSVVTPKGKQPRSLTLGALQHSYLLHSSGVDVFQNESAGVHGEPQTISFTPGKQSVTPRKGLLMRGETTMMLMSPGEASPFSSSGLGQLDIEAGKIVSHWKFEKDGVGIGMRDITGDTKGAQLDPGQATFLGLDDNRLCRWDMRDKRGVVQQLASPTLSWAEGHQFARGTNFQCFASTGNGCVAVGSRDGKVRMYSTTSMRQAKSVFPSLGAPITHVDVTYDGKWVLATTDKYLALIYTVFKDKNDNERCAFEARVGGKLAAPRLLRLTPFDASRAGAEFKFEGAQFSWVTEEGRYERNIVAHVKEYTVVWNLRRVKINEHSCYIQQSEGLKTCSCYKIVRRNESVLESKFMHDNFCGPSTGEVPLVVATPHKISSLTI